MCWRNRERTSQILQLTWKSVGGPNPSRGDNFFRRPLAPKILLLPPQVSYMVGFCNKGSISLKFWEKIPVSVPVGKTKSGLGRAAGTRHSLHVRLKYIYVSRAWLLSVLFWILWASLHFNEHAVLFPPAFLMPSSKTTFIVWNIGGKLYTGQLWNDC